jgi:hypothetical protein
VTSFNFRSSTIFLTTQKWQFHGLPMLTRGNNSRRDFQRSKLSAVGSAHNILIEQPPSRDWLQPYRKDVGNTDLVFRRRVNPGDWRRRFEVSMQSIQGTQCRIWQSMQFFRHTIPEVSTLATLVCQPAKIGTYQDVSHITLFMVVE